MEKVSIPANIRTRLVRASELSPLEAPEARCLCNNCASVLYPEREFKWATVGAVLERCEICKQPTFPKEFQKRRFPLKYLGE